MASVPVTIIGHLSFTDVGVGGGPMPGGPRPEHPIAPGGPGGGQPPGTWGGVPPNYIDIGGPGPQPHPDQGLPPGPAHPIVIPPTQPGQPPLVIWGGGNEPFPTPPIQPPPGGWGGGGQEPPTGGPPERIVEWHTAWSEQTGWVVVGTPKIPHPAPSQ